MTIPSVPVPQSTVRIWNLYDVLAAQNGTLEQSEVRGLGVEDWVVDLNVLSLELPSQIVEYLGLTAERVGSRRLSPVRVDFRDRKATIEPFLGSREQVVIGHVFLTALNLKYDAEWGLIDDTILSR